MPAPLIPLALAAAQTITGFINKGKAKKTAEELEATRPKYQINNLFQDDLDLSESELANGGLSSRAETAYNNLNNQQFSSSLDAILKSGGSVNNIADVFGENEEGRQRLALLNDQARVGHIERLMRSRRAMAEQEDKKFEFNEWRPWADKARANADARTGADEQIWGGLKSGAATGMQWWDQENQNKQFEKYLKTFSAANNSVPSSVGEIPISMGSSYDMEKGNQLDLNTPGFNPNGGGGNPNPWNWYNPNG